MKTIIAIFIVALVFTPIASLQPQSHSTAWPASYAHWRASDSREDAMWLAYADAPPPRPNDSWNCIPWNPWLCKGDRPPLR
jgi:hypothetical protein